MDKDNLWFALGVPILGLLIFCGMIFGSAFTFYVQVIERHAFYKAYIKNQERVNEKI